MEEIKEMISSIFNNDQSLKYCKLPRREDIPPCSDNEPMSCILALGLPRNSYIEDGFPIILRRLAEIQDNDGKIVTKYMDVIEKLVAYYGIKVIFDTDHTRIHLGRKLVASKTLQPLHLVLNRLYQRDRRNHIKLTRPNLTIMDYSPKFNVLKTIKPIFPHEAAKTIWRPYANMFYSKFLVETSVKEYTPLVNSIIAKPFILACGSNRRDYTGVVYAAEKMGMNLIIAETKTYKELNLVEKPLLKVVKLTHEEFNVVLTQADYVIIPADLPRTIPVGIGTIARTKMARKITIAVNNTGIDKVITHGVDGFLIPDPSAKHEAKYESYQKIFTELQDETKRRKIEEQIDVMAQSDEVAGLQMVNIAKCIATHSIESNTEDMTMFVLHHVNNCHACGQTDWCDYWQVSDKNVGVKGRYGSVGSNLEDSCDAVMSAAIVQIVKNPSNGKLYVATACPDDSS